MSQLFILILNLLIKFIKLWKDYKKVTSMEIQFLGTGAGQPAKARNVSSLVLKLLDEINEVWMFDCGEGTQRQIFRNHD